MLVLCLAAKAEQPLEGAAREVVARDATERERIKVFIERETIVFHVPGGEGRGRERKGEVGLRKKGVVVFTSILRC